MGYIVKPFDEKDLFTTIEIALFNHAQKWQPESWHTDVINRRFNADFTPKEIEVLQDIFEGKTNRQLCEKHHISMNTIKTHVKRIYDKLQVHSRSEAMAMLRKGLGQTFSLNRITPLLTLAQLLDMAAIPPIRLWKHAQNLFVQL